MSSVTIGVIKERLEFSYSQVDLLAGTTQSILCPVDGFIDGMDLIVETAVTTGGTVTLQGGGAVFNLEGGLDTTSAPGAAQGDTPVLNPVVAAVVTITIAAPAVVTSPNHGLAPGSPVVPTTTGALPTGLTASTQYYVAQQGWTPNSYQLTTTVGGGAAGLITTTGTQSGVQTMTSGQQGTIPITGCAQVIPNSATKGTRYRMSVPSGDPSNLVVQGQLLQITAASFATAGALYGSIRFRSNR